MQAWNRYAYVNNNPVRYDDPTGHFIPPVLFVALVEWGPVIVDAIASAVTAYMVADAMSSDTSAISADTPRELKIGIIVVPGAPALPSTINQEQAVDDEFSGLVYRGGGRTPSNFTPRPDKDVEQAIADGNTPGLSTYNSPQNLQQYGQAKPGSAYQVLDTSQLQSPLKAVLDDAATGHVTITTDLDSLRDWSATRPLLTPETSFDAVHVFTQMLNNIWTAFGKLPK